jgi:hypothetical protein
MPQLSRNRIRFPLHFCIGLNAGLTMRLNVRALAQTPRSANAEILRAASSFDLSCQYVPVYRKIKPRVVMVKSGQDGVRAYGTGSLNRPRIRRIFV